MKRYLIIGFILLIGQVAQSQEGGKFSFDIQFGPQISYRTRTLGFTIENDDWSWADNPILTFSGGIVVYYKVSERIELGSGLVYSEKGYKQTTHLPADIVSESIPEMTIANNKYQFIDVPLLFVYRIKDYAKVGFSIQTGLALDYLVRIKHKVDSYFPNGRTETDIGITDDREIYKNFNLSAKLGFGINYKVSNRISLGLNPMFDYNILNYLNENIGHDLNGSGRFWDIGGMIVIKHRF